MMLRRSVLELSARRSFRRIPGQIGSQRVSSPSPFVSSRKEFSTTSPQNGKQPQSKSNLPNVLLGSAVVAGAALLAYRSGYLDKYIGKEEHGDVNLDKVDVDREHLKGFEPFREQPAASVGEEPGKLSPGVELIAKEVETRKDLPSVEVEQKVETGADVPHAELDEKVESHVDLPSAEAEQRIEAQTDQSRHESLSSVQTENQQQVQEVTDVSAIDLNQEKKEHDFPQGTNLEGCVGEESTQSNTTREPYEEIQIRDAEGVMVTQNEKAAPLLDAYHLKERADENTLREDLEEQALASAVEKLSDGYITKDGQVIMNFLHAIHEAEKRQAELDARAFEEEIRILKEKYEKEIRDLKARELMRAEEAAMLEKEIKREKTKGATAIKTLQEKLEEKLRRELEQKDNEAQTKLKEIQELAKAEKDAAVAKEKALQIEKIAEANLHINALCAAFYARSEEAQQINSIHKLALGALALEDALSKGLPIERELDALNIYLEGADKDSLLQLVMSTLPEETRRHGTDTLLQLKQKFNGLKGNLRHYILLPPGGGGIFAHALSEVASWLRIKEVDPSGDGIESLISRVENFLADGKLTEAADVLQEGVRGSQAEEIIGDWVRQARNRAITEQALTVIQSYATCISLTH